LAIGIICILAFILIGYIFNASKNLGCFNVKDILMFEGDSSQFSYLKGRNIFKIDLDAEADYISRLYPDFKKVRIVRVLPDRLFVDLVERLPLARVSLYKEFFVDGDGVLFNVNPDKAALELPKISGLETKIFGAKSGKKYNVDSLLGAIKLIKDIKANRVLRKHKINEINVGRSDQITIIMDDYLEVKLDSDTSRNKIDILAGWLSQIKPGKQAIEYVDLRFRDPVVKYKDDAKQK